jgi:hypothetical protein
VRRESVRVVRKEDGLARKSGSYKFEKRKKELKKQKKRQEKLRRKRGEDASPEPAPETGVAPPDLF